MSRVLVFTMSAFVALGTHATRGETLNRWIQYGPDNTVFARAIVAGSQTQPAPASCPALAVDGAPVAMAVRSTPSAAFPVTLCEATLTLGPRAAVIDGVTLKLPVANPQRIVVVGDTGCRIQTGAVQNCNDPVQFPLATLSHYVAAFNPDLIVHVGDYYYREKPCPPANAGNGATTGCGGSPYGDTWDSWAADWFTPAQAMMAAAPLALSRGNHESCDRGEKGWFTLLDPARFDPASIGCAAGSAYDFTPPYIVHAGAVSLLMFDSSYASDQRVRASTVTQFQAQLATALKQVTQNTIFVTHKPAYGLISARELGSSGVITVAGGDADEQSMFGASVPQPIKMLLSGHIHNYQAVQVSDPNYAPQLVIGVSGTLLDQNYVPGNQAGNTYTMPGAGTSATLTSTFDQSEFGFAVLDAAPGGYTVNLYDLNGMPHGRCVIQLEVRNLACTM